jgi:hypothetical protein
MTVISPLKVDKTKALLKVDKTKALLKVDKTKALLKVLTYSFSGFSIIFIGYILIDTLLNYPPKMIGISP